MSSQYITYGSILYMYTRKTCPNDRTQPCEKCVNAQTVTKYHRHLLIYGGVMIGCIISTHTREYEPDVASLDV